MKKKLLIASVALSGLVGAQCTSKCGYNQDADGNTVHIKACNEFMYQEYVNIFDRAKTDNCKLPSCLIIINNGDTLCWNHDDRAEVLRQEQLEEDNSFSHYQYERPDGTPYPIASTDCENCDEID